MNQSYQTIISMASNGNNTGIQTIYSHLLQERMKMDKFFTMYLDKFERKMDAADSDTAIWELYKKKLKEYSELEQTIKIAEYYMKKSYA